MIIFEVSKIVVRYTAKKHPYFLAHSYGLTILWIYWASTRSHKYCVSTSKLHENDYTDHLGYYFNQDKR